MEDKNILLLSVLSTIFLLLLAFKFLFQCRGTHKNLPPSPPSLPIIGHLHLVKPLIHRTFLDISQKYGPVISLKFGSRLVVVVTSSSAAEECFTKNDAVLANRPRQLSGKHLAYNHTTLAGLPYGDHWRNLRRFCANEIFSSSRLNASQSVRKDEVRRLLLKLSRNSSSQGFTKVELKSALSELTFNNIMRMTVGKRYYGDDVDVNDEREAAKFKELIVPFLKSVSPASNPADFIPMLKWVNGSYEKKLKMIGKQMDAFLQWIVDEHRRKQGGDTMIDHLLSMQQSQSQYYTDTVIKGLILVMVLAGTDTSAVTLEWAMANLLNHSAVLEKVRAELDANIGQEKLMEEADLSKLPFLQCFIQETHRLYPPGPLLLPHEASSDCTIGGYDVPRETIVLFNVWAIHRDPDLWDDPLSFKPERFENGKAEGYKLMPFGMGRRNCPGASLAQRIVGLTLGSLIQCFEWKSVSAEEIDMAEGDGATMPKAQPLEALCKARPVMKKVLEGLQ